MGEEGRQEMIQVFDCDQNSDEWYRARMGIPTASGFSNILAKGEGKTRRSYLLRLAGEVITGEPGETYESQAMQRGHEMEAEARELYAFAHDAEPQLVGFIRNGDKGCSPDALIGTNGILEIKTKRADLLIDVLLKGEFPLEHKAQVQGSLWIAEREYVDLCIYWPRLPLFTVRATRDEVYIYDLAKAVDKFNDELAETVERIRRYGQPLKDTLETSLLMAG